MQTSPMSSRLIIGKTEPTTLNPYVIQHHNKPKSGFTVRHKILQKIWLSHVYNGTCENMNFLI